MLYRLNLKSLDSYIEFLQNSSLIINYKPYSNYMQIYSDRETLVVANKRDILNIKSLIKTINEIKKSDLIWVKYGKNYVLARVEDKISLDKLDAKIKINCKIYISSLTPKVVKESFDDFKFSEVKEDYIKEITEKILEIYMSKAEDEQYSLETLEKNIKTLKSENISKDIVLYKKDFHDTQDNLLKINKMKKEKNDDSGLVIQVNCPEEKTIYNLPVKRENVKKETKEEFYKRLMKEQIDFYMNIQRETMNQFMDMEEKLWKEFFELME